MGDLEALLHRAEQIAQKISKLEKEGRSFMIVSHQDADGIAAASLLAQHFSAQDANVTIRFLGDLSADALDVIASSERDFYIFSDIGASASSRLDEALGEAWVSVEHHRPPDDELSHPRVFNAWQFNFDGGKEISGTGMTWWLTQKLGIRKDLITLPIIGALADRQDGGDHRSMIGLNSVVLGEAQKSSYVDVISGLVFYGRESRPIYEAIALSHSPYIPGLTGNKDVCLSTLHRAGMRMKEGSRWRTVSELSEEETKQLVDVLIPYLTTGTPEVALSQLIGNVYILQREDDGPTHDAREFATLLNACGRSSVPELGLMLGVGERGEFLAHAKEVLQAYRQKLGRYITQFLTDRSRSVEDERSILMIGDELVEEDMLGPVASTLASVVKSDALILAVRTRSGDTDVRFSLRALSSQAVDLGAASREAALRVGGTAGGHAMAAGGRVPYDKFDEFYRIFKQVASDRY
jgi:RecJ-like exonuclease